MAVYTKISQSDVENLLATYQIGKLENYSAITAGIQNSNYFLNTNENKYVLTIYEERTSLEDLPFFLNLTEHLAKHGVPCPLPITNNKGEKLSIIAGKPCAIISFVEGSEAKNIKISHIKELGRSVAKLHLVGQDFPQNRVNEIGIAGWRSKFNSVKDRADEIAPGLSKELAETRKWINSQWPENLSSGIIHGDIFPDNVLFANDGKIAGIIDFYFACTDILMYDLAICMNAWCFDDNKNFNADKAKALILAYDSVRKIPKEELTALPILATGASMRFLLTRMYDWLNRVDGAIVNTKDPLEYLEKLRFHNNIKSYEEYWG